MGIFEKLFNGKIYIAESSRPQSEEYNRAAHSLSDASKKLEKVLDGDQLKLLEAYQTARADVEILVQINVSSKEKVFTTLIVIGALIIVSSFVLFLLLFCLP